MGKQELVQEGFWSKWIGGISGLVGVERGGFVGEAMATLKNALSEKWGVLVCPEGTRTNDGSMGQFKKGAALLALEAGVPVIPAFIEGSYAIYPKGKKCPRLFDWKRRKRYEVQVTFGEPIPSESTTIEELTSCIESAIRRLEAPLKESLLSN